MGREHSRLPATISHHFVKYINTEELKGLVQSMANSLSEEFKDQELLIIGHLKGSSIFLADLIREIKDVKISLDFVRLSSIGRTKDHLGTITLEKDIKSDIEGKNILIVEDILDTARALDFLIKRIQLSNPQKVAVVTLFDKARKRSLPLEPQYVGKQIEDQFLIGYGMDIEDYGRNLKDVYFLKYPQ